MTDVESIPLIRDKHTGPNRKKVLLGGILLLLGSTLCISQFALSKKGRLCFILLIAQLIPMNMLFSRKDVSLESPVAFKGHLVKGLKGGVAVEVQQCSEVGVQGNIINPDHLICFLLLLLVTMKCLVLKDGGNAVDSAIAANLCIGVINNFATGKRRQRS